MRKKMIKLFLPTFVTIFILSGCVVGVFVFTQLNGQRDFTPLFRCCLDENRSPVKFLKMCQTFKVDVVKVCDMVDVGECICFFVKKECFVLFRTGQLLKFKDEITLKRIYKFIDETLVYRRGNDTLRNEDAFMRWRRGAENDLY